MTSTRALMVAISLGLAVPASAAEPAGVASARAAGLIGERFDGYLGVASTISPTVRSQVGSINITRRTLYSQLAVRRGVTPQEVAITAGCTLLAATPVGGSYQLSDNQWRKRLAGQAAPRPDYCR
jgi:uncharacterized protein YdbL (DUF1318 family)